MSCLKHQIQWVTARERAFSTALVLLVLCVGTIYALRLGDTLRYPDERDYYTLATNLIATGQFSQDGHTPTAFRAPGYPMALALVALIQPSVVAMRLLNIAALALSIVLLGRILRRQGSPLAALIATVLATVYPCSAVHGRNLVSPDHGGMSSASSA